MATGDGVLLETISKQVFADMNKLIEQLNKQIKLVDTLTKDFKQIKLPSQVTKAQKDTTTAIKQTNAAIKNHVALNSKLRKAIQANVDARTKQNKVLTRVRFETQQLNKANKEEAILTSKLSTEYQKQQVKLTQLKKAYADLALKKQLNGKLSKQEEAQLKRTKRALDQKDRALKRVDAQMGINNRHVGNYKRSLMGLGSSLLGAFGVVSGVMIFAQVLRSTIGIVVKFDKSMVDLSAVLGKSRKELKGLEDIIRGVAATSTKTAVEVADLASTLATLGKTEEEIKQLIEPVNNLSIALDATSAEAGELLIATLNAFGRGSNAAVEFADIIAKMRTSTALDFERIKDALGFLAPTANAAGISFEKTGAILGVLVNNGIRASRAGRLMSSTFLRLAKDGKDLEQGLNDIREAQEKGVTETELLSIAAQSFGVQSAALGIILANNKQSLIDLTRELENAGGSLEDLTNDKMEALIAQLQLLNSSWTDFILNIEKGDGIIGKATVSTAKHFTSVLDGLSIFSKETTTNTERLKLWAFAMTQMINGLFGAKGAYEDDIIALFKHNAAIRQATGDIGALTEAQSKLNDETEDWFSIINESGGGGGATNSYGEALGRLNDKLKNAKEKLDGMDVSNIKAIRTQQSLIESIKNEIKVLKGLGEALKGIKRDRVEQVVLIESEEEAIKKLNVRYQALLKTWKELGDTEIVGDTEGLSPVDTVSTSGDGKQKGLDSDQMDTLRDSILGVADALGISELTVDSFFDAFEDGVITAEELMTSFALLAVDAVNMINDAQRTRTMEHIDRLQTEKDIAIAFAGDSAAAKGEIEERFAEKRKKLLEKQAKNDKKAAIITGIINTAAGVVKALASSPPPANFILAALVGALGAAQVGIIASQPIPQFEKGTKDSPAGLALVNEKRNEVIVSPDGNVFRPKGRNQFVNLQEHSQVFKSEADFDRELGGLLGSNGINSYGVGAHAPVVNVIGNTLTSEDMERAFKNALKGRANNVTTIDKHGFSTYATAQLTKRNILNNRVTFKGKNV